MSGTSRFWLGFVMCSATACGPSEPDCAAFSFTDLKVETTAGGPQFSWSGDATEYLEVYPGTLDDAPSVAGFAQVPPGVRPSWDLLCQCQETDSCENEVGCLAPPVAYGTVPEGAAYVSEQVKPQGLVSGDPYSLLVGAYCQGDRIVQDGDHGFVGAVEVWVGFTAP